MTKSRRKRHGLAAFAVIVALASSCNGDGDDTAVVKPPGPEDGDPTSWTPGGDTGECNLDALLAPRPSGAKVKTLLTGLPLDDGELQSLEADPAVLGSLIDDWLALPESDAVLERFFMTAFQQTSGDNASLFNLLGRNATGLGFYLNPRSPNADEMLNANFSESFALTALDIVKQGRPFSDVLTTDTFMMTTAMASFLAFSDDEVVDDEEDRTVRTTVGHFPVITLVRDQVDAPPASEAFDPNHPNFATFWHPDLVDLDPTCNVAATQTIDTSQNVVGEWRLGGGVSPSFFMFSALVLGRMQSVQRHQSGCNTGADNEPPQLNRSDFSDWRPVRVSKPVGSETPTLFYEMPTLRSATELKLHTDRIGFLTHPGFFSTWATNEDNSSRVTINQALIVALGKSFEGEAVTNFSPDNLDGEHVEPDSECYGCHQTLDPMRDYFRASFTNFYGQQLDPARANLQADFVFGEVQTNGNGVADLAQVLAAHPLFPYGWAHRLCYYANSDACAEGEELDRVVGQFVDSNFDFRVLVRELFASPLVTGSACVSGVDAGTTAIISRRSTFCSQLSNRLEIPDLCGVRTHFRDANNLQNDVRDAVASVPDDSFSRAEVAPVVIAETGLFARANREAACVITAQDGYDLAFNGLTADAAVDKMVITVMGLPPSDSRHTEARAILMDHVNEVMNGGDTEQVALQSALALACMAPGSAGIGF